MKRSGGPKRKSNISRTKRPSRSRRYRTTTDIEMANKRNFHEAAWKQRVCQECGKGGAHESHHVVEKQKLRQINRWDVVWDTRNCLRLCPACHHSHTVGFRRVKLQNLTDDNYEFAFHILGAGAFYYLRDRYNGKDARLSDHLTRWEEEHGDTSDDAAPATG